MTSEPLDAQDQIPEVENLFEEATVKAAIKKANPQSAAGPSGLCYSHLAPISLLLPGALLCNRHCFMSLL